MSFEDVNINADSLYNSLPAEVKRNLSEIGITSVDYSQMSELDFGRVLEKTVSMLNTGGQTAFVGMSVCMGIMLWREEIKRRIKCSRDYVYMHGSNHTAV